MTSTSRYGQVHYFTIHRILPTKLFDSGLISFIKSCESKRQGAIILKLWGETEFEVSAKSFPLMFDDVFEKYRLIVIGLPPPEEGDDKKPSDNANNSVDHFRTWLLEAMREMTKKDSLEPDEDGDIPVDFGSSCTYLSPRANPLSVDIYSVLLSEVNQSPALLAAINEANCETLFAKVKYLSEHKQIILHHEIAADSLNEGSLKRHVIHLGRMADSLDSEFKREFGGVMHGIDSREDEQDV